MKDVIYINNHSGQMVEEGYPNSTAYYSEENVRNAIRYYLEQANRLIERNWKRAKSSTSNEDDFDIIAVTRNTESFIKRLKGGEK